MKYRSLTGILVSAATLVTAAYGGDWHQWHGPNRDGISTETGLPSTWTPGPAGSQNVAWRQATNIGRESETSNSALDAGSPVVVGSEASGRIFFMHSMESRVSSRTICLRESDGAFLWDYATNVYGGDAFEFCPDHQGAATPYVDAANGSVYTGTKEGRLLSLDFSGNLLWRRLTQNNVNDEDPNAFDVVIHNCGNATPVLDGNNVIFPLAVGDPPVNEGKPALVALDRSTGNTVWTQSFFPYSPPRNAVVHGSWSSPIVATTPDGVRRVFYQFGDGSVRSVRASDGQLLWTHADNSGMASAHGGTGQEGVPAPVYNPPGPSEVESGAVYVAAGVDPSAGARFGQGALWKLDAETGTEIWTYRNTLGNVGGSVTISENRLYIGDLAGFLHCVDITTGTEIWREELGGGEIWASPSVANGKVYIGTQDGDFYILEDAATFNVLDVDNVGSRIGSSVAIANGAIYVKSDDYIWKVRDTSGPSVLTTIVVSPDPAAVVIGGDQQFTAQARDQFGNPMFATFTWSATGGTIDSTGLYTAGSAPGSYSVTATSDGVSGSAVVNVLTPGATATRMNVGGGAYTDSSSNLWVVQQAYSAGSFGYEGGTEFSTGDTIAGTVDDPLFQSFRYGISAARFDVPNGDYQVRLLFADIFNTSPGQRVFDVSIEGTLVLDDLDVIAMAGGHDIAMERTFNASVEDGTLDVTFTPNVSNPILNAVEVISLAGKTLAPPQNLRIKTTGAESY